MGYNFRASYSFIVAVKLEVLKSDLEIWNKNVFGNVSPWKETTFNEIGFWDSKEREGGLSHKVNEARRTAREE